MGTRKIDGYTGSMLIVLGVLRASHLEEPGVSRILREAGLDSQSLARPYARVPKPTLDRVWRAAFRISGDRDLALHAAEEMGYGSYRVMDYLAAYAASVRDAWIRAAWLLPLLTEWLILEAEQGRRECVLYLGSYLGEPLRHWAEFIFASLLVRTRQACGPDWKPLRVDFAFPAPRAVAEHRRLFRCPLVFDAPLSRMTVERPVWDRPLEMSSPGLFGVLEEYARILLAAHSPTRDLEAMTRRALEARGANSLPTLQAAARDLGMSPRSLQRQLQGRYSGFTRIRDSVRSASAEALLRDSSLTVAEIADRLGFDEPASFTRAFRRWTGLSPREYRSQQATSPG